MNIYKAKAYLKYKIRAKYKKGHGVHPPFAYDLVRNILFEKLPYYKFKNIDGARNQISKSKLVLKCGDNDCVVSSIANKYLINKRVGELIFRLIVRFAPKNIVEFGASLAENTMYLALPNSKSKVVSLISNTDLVEFYLGRLKSMQLANVQSVKRKDFADINDLNIKLASIDFAFFSETKYFKLYEDCKKTSNGEQVFIFNNIYESKESEELWMKVCNDNQVDISFDLFSIGIAIINKDVKKQHYVVSWM